MSDLNSAGNVPSQPVQQSQSALKRSRQSVRSIWIYAFALAAGCMAATQLTFPAHFETVDDLNFTLLLSGVGLTHTPTFTTWFTNVLITYPLMWLYQLTPVIPWYSIYLFSALAASFTIFAAVFMLRFNWKVGAALFLTYYIAVGAQAVNALQYTSTAALLSQAGFLLVFCLPLTERFRAKDLPNWMIVVGFIATVFAAMIRFEPFMLVISFSSITILAVASGKLDLIKRHGKPLCWFVVAVLIGAGLKTANNLYYDTQPAYAGVRDLFKPFSEIADSDRKYIREKKHQLSENDFALVKQFFVADSEVFTTDAMSRAVAGTEIPFTARKLQWVLSSEILPVLLLCLSMVWLLDFKIMNKKRLAVWFSGIVLLILYLAFFMKLPPRVHLTLLTCTMTTLFAFIDRAKLKRIAHNLNQANQAKRIAAFAMIFAIAGWLAFSTISLLYEDWQYFSDKGKRITVAIKALNPQPGQLFVVLGTSTPYQFIRPFQNLRDSFATFDIYRTSLWGRLPVGYNMLENHGFSSLLDACRSRNVFFISNPSANNLFTKFCAEHYQTSAVFTHVFGDPNVDFDVYSLKLTPRKKV